MKKLIIEKWILLYLFMLITGCSDTHTVNTPSTKSLQNELKITSKSIQNVKFTFTRPELRCTIDMAEEPSQQEMDSIMAKIKAFATIENMNEIRQNVHWNMEISGFHVNLSTDGDRQTIEYAYFAKYFKTSDASNLSTENIDAYRTWYEEKWE
jgi:hypothetical protein